MPVFIALPEAGDPEADQASEWLQSLIEDENYVVYVLLGKPHRFEDMLAVAKGRAGALSSLRRVVHVPDPSLLTADQVDDIRGGANHVAAIYGLDNTVKARLKAGHAVQTDLVEDAFSAAESDGA